MSFSFWRCCETNVIAIVILITLNIIVIDYICAVITPRLRSYDWILLDKLRITTWQTWNTRFIVNNFWLRSGWRNNHDKQLQKLANFLPLQITAVIICESAYTVNCICSTTFYFFIISSWIPCAVVTCPSGQMIQFMIPLFDNVFA